MFRANRMYQGHSTLTNDKDSILKTIAEVLLITAVCLAITIDFEPFIDWLLS